jgi:hypothetical protein
MTDNYLLVVLFQIFLIKKPTITGKLSGQIADDKTVRNNAATNPANSISSRTSKNFSMLEIVVKRVAVTQ